MGTTLQNGVYLPNEGERNCYAGLKTNWEILDQKVADVTALQQAVAGALHREIVESLPTTDIDPNTIYMILSGTGATENVYNEFMYVNNAWELIGTSATDLTNYYTKGDVDGLLLLKANASDLTSHTGDTTIHVTSADKSKWNTVALIKQLRLVNTQVGSATTIAFVNIDDTNGIKVGDKCMDLDGRMFEITAVDTTNQTVTVGSALIDLALDANVVHTSGNETISGTKTFSATPYIYNPDSTENSPNILFRNSKYSVGDTTDTGEQRIIYADKNGAWTGSIASSKNIAGTQYLTFTVYSTDNNNANISSTINYYLSKNGDRYFTPYEDNLISLGSTTRRWKYVCATNYYYGSNNVEFSTKFVTTDTNQTISGQKLFDDINTVSSSSEIGVSGGNRSYKVLDKNKKTISSLEGGTFSSGMAYSYWLVNNGSDVFNGVTLYQPSANLAQLRPYNSTLSMQLGASNRYFSDCYTSKINGLEPSSLSLPSDRSARIDISSYITNLGNGDNNQYIVPANGYIWLHFTNINSALCYSQTSGGLTNYAQTFVRYQGDGQLYAFFPVRKNDYFIVQIYTASTAVVQNAYFIPCQGNV